MSATSLDPTGCDTGSAATTFAGQLALGQKYTTPADCIITFGSSNNTALLRVSQTDGRGVGLWMPPTGPLDSDHFGAATCPCPGAESLVVPGTVSSFVTDVAIQPDGKIVMVGRARVGGGDYEMFVTRLNANGTTDLAFGTSGFATLNPTAVNDAACCVLVRSDGKIVVGGVENFDTDGDDTPAAEWLLNSDGTTDDAFGTSGDGTIVIHDPNGRTVWVNGMAQMPDGDVAITGAPSGREVFVAMVRPDGTLDPAYDGQPGMPGSAPYPGNGVVVYNYTGGCGWTFAAAAQPDGKLLVGGISCSPGAVLRLTADGKLDTSFGTGGVVLTSTWGDGYVAALATQPDGKILVGGTSASNDFRVERLNADGTLDNTFGTSGQASIAVGTASTSGQPCPPIDGAGGDGTAVCSIHVLPDGRIMLAGVAQTASGWGFGLVRLTASGALDPSFGAAGKEIMHVSGSSTNDRPFTMEPTQDGSLVIAGRSGSRSAVMQLVATPVNDFASGTDDWSTGENAFGACLSSATNGASTATGPTPAATWQQNAGCSMLSGAWYPVPAQQSAPGAKIAQSTTSDTTSAQVDLQFGFRTSINQVPGTYLAPLDFEVVAPNV